MAIELSEGLWLHEHYTFSLAQLSELSGLTEPELREMVEYGILSPLELEASHWLFGADRWVVARQAKRLSRNFDLDTPRLALVFTLMERIRGLEDELCALRAKFPGIAD